MSTTRLSKWLLISMLCFFSYNLTVHAATLTAISCGSTDVQNAINAASDGDTVVIPACTKTIWTAQVAIPSSKNIDIHGAGIDQTVISYNYVKSGLSISLGSNKIITVHDLTMTSEVGVDPSQTYGVISVSGNKNGRFRIHHIKFDNYYTSRGIVADGVRGVVDHNTFNKICNTQGLLLRNSSWNGGGFGDGKWADSFTSFWGTDDAVFIEDNTFTSNDTGCGANWLSAVDCDQGGRFVFRYNIVNNARMTAHGFASGGRQRSCLSAEVYQNTVTQQPNPGNGDSWFVWYGGTALVYNNAVSGFNYLFKIAVQRESEGAFWIGWCNDSTGPKYMCSNRQYDCTSTGGTPDQSICSALVPAERCLGPVDDPTGDGKGYPCFDQAGQGPHAIGATNLEPIYVWNNTLGGRPTGASSIDTFATAGRDYYNIQKTGYTPYAYPHPLANSSVPRLRAN